MSPSAKAINRQEGFYMLLWNNEYHKVLSRLLKQARKEVFLSTFKIEIPSSGKHYALKNIITLITTLKDMQIDIKILLHHSIDTPGQPRQNLYSAKYLSERGIPVKHLKGRRIIHAKMFIIDQKYLIFGSHNLSSTSLQHNLELSILIKEPALIKDSRDHFLHYWSEAEPFPHPPPSKTKKEEVI